MIYEHILASDEELTIYSIVALHKLLYNYSPFPEVGGLFRASSACISGSCVEAVPYWKIREEIYLVDKEFKEFILESTSLSITEYIDKCIQIHHRLTVIHPFSDGNGRVTRAFLNWLFKQRNLPPIYIKLSEKEMYYDGLKEVDKVNNYEKLEQVIYSSIINSLVQLNGMY